MAKTIFEIDSDNMSVEDMQKIIMEQIRTGKGLISYRKHLKLLKNLYEKQEELSLYRASIIKDVDEELFFISENIENIRQKVYDAVVSDDSIRETESGGKTLKLPDVGTVSLSKKKETIVIEDAKKVLEKLGDDYAKTTVTLDTAKAKAHMKDIGEIVDGATIREDRTLTIKFK